jgi:NAD+ synthase
MPVAQSAKQKDADVQSLLRLDAEAEVERISEFLRTQLGEVLERRGLVIAMSGGVDSSVCAALAVRAVGPKRVFGLMMPEQDSDPRSRELAIELAEQLGIKYEVEDIAPILAAAGCYRRRDDAIRRAVPEYGDGWASKIVLPGDRLESDRLNVYYLTVRNPAGELSTVRLPVTSYLEIVAATNFKQRVRKMLEYHHADRLHYAVMGSPNRLEWDQGFFVKGGDGLADVKPIAHLYKTQVYQLAAHLNVPKGITNRPPTTDTYSLPQTQEEFYFSLPAATLDLVLYARNNGWSAEQAAERLGLTAQQVTRAYTDIDQKRMTTNPLHVTSLLVQPVPRGTFGG